MNQNSVSASTAAKIRAAVGSAFLKAVIADEVKYNEEGIESNLLKRLDTAIYADTGMFDEDGMPIMKRISPIGRHASVRWYAHSIAKTYMDGRERKLPRMSLWNAGTRTAEPASPEDVAAFAYAALRRWEGMEAIPEVETARASALA